ncbi:MAG TPA: response regulator [Chloroflexi bacterium]|nr:response regulator [Chloroflexota bacterium]
MSSTTLEIFIVEDDNDTADMLAEMVRLSGYRVRLYHGAHTVLAALRHTKPAAMILDIMMPDISGLDVLREIRNDARLQALPVILLSAKSTPLEIEEGMQAGANLYLTKPVRFDELQRAIEEVLAVNTT